MRKLTAFLFATLVVLGLASCYEDCDDVLPQPQSLTLSPSVATLQVGDTKQLTATVEPTDQNYTVTFTSDNEQVATVDANGLVKAVAEGTANITAQVGDLKEKCVVTVSNSAPKVTLTVDPPALTIEKGKTAQIKYTVTPADTPVTFTSDKTNIATVNATGLVTAVAAGSATITVDAPGQEAQVAVTVTEVGGGTVTQGNELPLLMFEATLGANGVTTQAVLDHEAKVGRTAQPFKFWNQGPFKGGFVNKDLTIVGAIYGLSFKDLGEYVLPAFSKETLADCPKTMAMLKEYGFTKFTDGKDKDNNPFKKSVCDTDPTVYVEMFDDPNAEIGSTLMLLFAKPMPPKKDLDIEHALLPAVKDFPSWEAFITGDMAKMKEFEANLGFRDYTPGESDEAQKNLSFDTPDGKMAQTNFYWVYYVTTPESGTKFIDCQVNFIKSVKDLKDPKIKEWFTANGYGKDFFVDTDNGYASGKDATGKIVADIFINSKGTAAKIQIYEDDSTQSATQMRRLAMRQFDKMKSLTKHRKLQQMRRR
ncbi:Ig-like domain-containing protein [Porphyromonas uenonis]|uniref:Ig-like domain-containing protein n=1 Tax=Porphyromonas uenonis TaxID=281920 RepID=UPI0004709042|nr:Ig-like domain-containing protein [Porphyromonas uenonis]